MLIMVFSFVESVHNHNIMTAQAGIDKTNRHNQTKSLPKTLRSCFIYYETCPTKKKNLATWYYLVQINPKILNNIIPYNNTNLQYSSCRIVLLLARFKLLFNQASLHNMVLLVFSFEQKPLIFSLITIRLLILN